MDATQVLRELIAKWRDRANESEYKLHREWAIDQCADELEALLPTLESALGERQTMGTDDFQTPVDKRAQQLIDSNPGCTMSAAYRAVALELSNTIPPAVPVDQSAAAKAAHCICSEAYGVGPEKCGAAVHHPKLAPAALNEPLVHNASDPAGYGDYSMPEPAAPNERLRGLIEVWRDPANKDLSAFIIEIEVLLPQLEAAIRESQPPPSAFWTWPIFAAFAAFMLFVGGACRSVK